MKSKDGRPSSGKQGHLGENLVICDLLKYGYHAQLVSGQQRYDVIVDIGDRFLRIQVKTTSGVRKRSDSHRTSYVFRVSETSNSYDATEFDLIALVALDSGVIAYLPSRYATAARIELQIPDSPHHGRRKRAWNIDQLPFSKILKELK